MYYWFPVLPGIVIYLFVLAVIWSSVWKGIALWRAGRSNSLGWFVVMFIVNTLGILEILYIFVFSQRKSAGGAGTAGGQTA